MKPKERLDFKKEKIRAFFHTFTVESDKSEVIKETEIEKIEREGLEYVQMRLPIDEITQQKENELKEKIEGNIIKAHIREAKEEDLESVKAIYNRSWLTSKTPFRMIEIDTLNPIFKDPDTVFLIGKLYGQDAAFVILDFEGPNKEYAVIAGLGVIPKYQRKGLGTIMGMAAWNYLKEHFSNIKELRCEVYKNNTVSFNFIKNLGFEEYGTETYRREDFEP
ncbi:MAG: GNAT family N-acetyltransferase [Promethearchaeota archaeon]|nr:MAG: GNAT family N-acetyltransferase [Candidatus Lokiarchaeota archaeon]